MVWTPQLKGEAFELLLESKIASIKNVRCVTNIKIYSPHLGKLTEIDLLVVTPWRVYCLEAKSYTTSLSGNIEEDRWTGYTRDRSTALFNPIIQNFEHIRSLKYNLLKVGLYLNDIPSAVVVPDTCDISRAAMRFTIVKDISGFIGDLITDSLTLPSNLDTELILDRVYKVKAMYEGVRHG